LYASNKRNTLGFTDQISHKEETTKFDDDQTGEKYTFLTLG